MIPADGVFALAAAGRKSESLLSDSPFIPIATRTIRLNSRPPVDLFVAMNPDESPVLYAARDTVFNESHIARLEENQIDTLQIRREDNRSYRHYLETRLADILVDNSVDGAEKARIIHFASEGLIAELLDDPDADENFQRSAAMVENTVDFLFSDVGAVRHMIETAAFDFNTFAHAVGTMVYAVSLGARLGLRSGDAVHEFGQAAFLRDIGLSRVPMSSWDGESALSLTQFDSYKQHPVMSEQILRGHSRFSSNTLDLVRHHHERISGTGFPDGIGGRELGPNLRILSIAEMFDSLTLGRSFRPAHTTFQALKLMSNDMQADYDQDIMRAFIEMMGNPG